MLVADPRHSRLQIAHVVQTQAAENAADGNTAQACDLGNVEAVKPGADALRQRLPVRRGERMRTRGAILQTSRTLLIKADPLSGGAGADIKGNGGSLQSHPLKK
jgi:hypothetical protein